MKKVLIVAVCLAMVLTLAFTLGASGGKPGKPDKPGKPVYVNYDVTFLEANEGKDMDVTGTVHLGVQGRFICSSPIDRPTLTLSDIFEKSISGEDYSGECDGLYLDLSEHKGVITMQFFFFDQNDEKVQLNVYYGYVDSDDEDSKWLSSKFKIIFYDTDAKITPTEGKKFPPLWYGHLDITIECLGE